MVDMNYEDDIIPQYEEMISSYVRQIVFLRAENKKLAAMVAESHVAEAEGVDQ